MARNLFDQACMAGMLLALAAGVLRGEDWPSYRGPRRNGTSTETGLLDTWPQEGPKLLWETKLEPGNSSPVVADGRVFCLGRKGELGWNHPTTNKPEGPVHLFCLDRTDGKVLWTYDIPVAIQPDNTAMNTPTVDSGRVYARGGDGDVHCVSAKDGKPLWRWPKAGDAPRKHSLYKGTTLAPDIVIEGNLAIFCEGGSGYNCGQNLMAVDKSSGEIVWQYKRSMAPAYDTLKPEQLSVDDKRYLLVDHVALDPATGKELFSWGDNALREANNATTRGGETGYIGYANAVQGNMVYMNFCRGAAPESAPSPAAAPTGDAAAQMARKPEHGLLAMRFEHDKSGALTCRKQWEWLGERGSWVNSPALGGGCVFMNLGKDGCEYVCLDGATGRECWKYNLARLANVHCLYSEPLSADGKIFLSATGVVMIAADAKSFRVLGRAPLAGSDISSGGGGCYHAPALSDGRLFARNNLGSVFCFDLRKENTGESAKK